MSSKLSEPHGRSGNVGNAPTQRHRTRARPAIKSAAHEAEYSTNGGGAPARVSVEWEDEEAWLRARIIRLRTILRYAKDPQVEIGLKEFIADAEARLDMLERSRLRPLDTDAHRADKRPY